MTRTVAVGDPARRRQRACYDVVLRAQQAGRAPRSRAGVDVPRRRRAPAASVIAEAGWADAFSHGTGHGVGLEIHEAPRVASTVR